MEPGGSMPHSQGLSNNPYPEPNQPNFPALTPISSRSTLILSSHLRLGLPKDLFPAGLPVKILKALLLSSILDTTIANNIMERLAAFLLNQYIYFFFVFRFNFQCHEEPTSQCLLAEEVTLNRIDTRTQLEGLPWPVFSRVQGVLRTTWRRAEHGRRTLKHMHPVRTYSRLILH